jgi:undecaprenyl-diphosphatase
VLAWLIAGKIRKRWLKNLIWVISISLILLTGLSRIYLGVHYPSDVIASYAAATVWVLTIMFMDLLVRTKTRFIKKHDLNNKSNNRSL